MITGNIVGGEPLLYFDEIVYPISKKINDLCKRNNINFNNMITTNGYLMNENIMKKFNSINLRNFQITLDGDENEHNKIKKTKNNEKTYKKTIENILKLIDLNKNIHLLLRINYTENNYNSLSNCQVSQGCLL